jgi:2,4-dichlorophenol 6-monooxygenase
MTRHETTVLVVGAGPVGLTASLLLAQAGVEALVIDRRDGPHRAPQAHVVNPRTLEIFRQAGIDVEHLRTLATDREDGSWVRWMTRLDGEELGVLPYERQGDENLALTPTPLINLSQHVLEPILLESARAQRKASVHYRQQWEGLEQDADGITARIRDLTTGRIHDVRSRYVLAADGASSRVRRSLGIDMIGPDRLQSFVMIHFEANLRSIVETRPAILYWLLDPDSPGALVAHDIERTWVLMHAFDPATEREADYTTERCVEIVRAAIGREDVEPLVHDKSVWTMTAQIADRYRAGRVFLIGDSAHRFPPTGGMGMNTGIQDAHNLAWKLGAVERGQASPSLLDTYEIERRPVAQSNADQSLTNALKMVDVFTALGLSADREASRRSFRAALDSRSARADVATAIANQRDHFDMFGLQLGFRYETGALVPDGRDRPLCENPVRDFVPGLRSGGRLPHAWVVRDGRPISTLDLVARNGLTLITGTAGEAWVRAVTGNRSASVCTRVEGRDFLDLERRWASVREVGADGAVLVRPDQHVAWYAAAATSESLTSLPAAIAAVARR